MSSVGELFLLVHECYEIIVHKSFLIKKTNFIEVLGF